jgi:hypothetical protein
LSRIIVVASRDQEDEDMSEVTGGEDTMERKDRNGKTRTDQDLVEESKTCEVIR